MEYLVNAASKRVALEMVLRDDPRVVKGTASFVGRLPGDWVNDRRSEWSQVPLVVRANTPGSARA
jgi:hypothetical protein